MLIPTWHRDGELAADIAPTRQAASARGTTLITGAAGFPGRHSLKELLAYPCGPIYGLARSSEDGSAVDRVPRALRPGVSQ